MDIRRIVFVLLTVLGVGCHLDELQLQGEVPCPLPPARRSDVPVPPWQYVIDAIVVPTTMGEATALAMDLDHDSHAVVDNALGRLIATIVALSDGVDVNADLGALIDGGEILHLVEVHTASLDGDGPAAVCIHHGADSDGDPSDNFSGSERFTVDGSRGRGDLSGFVENGRLVVERGSAPIAVTFPGLDEPFVLQLEGVRIEADISRNLVVGRIGGGIRSNEIDEQLIPVLHEGLQQIVGRECTGGGCSASSLGGLLLALFDDDDDGALSPKEVRDSSVVNLLLRPDLDLFDENGEPVPSRDGILDSLSVSVGFTAVPARFVVP